jgi:hypothetical protein
MHREISTSTTLSTSITQRTTGLDFLGKDTSTLHRLLEVDQVVEVDIPHACNFVDGDGSGPRLAVC